MPTRRLNVVFFAWCVVLLSAHALHLGEPFVNQEFAFSEAARSLRDPTYPDGLARYWTHQANPLGYSAATALLLKVLSLPQTFWSVRLPSLLGGLALLLAGRVACWKCEGARADLFNLWCALCTLNPLAWFYTGAATADALPAGLTCLALALCRVAEGRWRWHLLAGLLFTGAVLTKLNMLLLLPGFVYLVHAPAAGPPARRAPLLACYTILPGAALAAYFAWLYTSFGIVLIPERFRAVHSPRNYADFPVVLARYASYVTLLLGLLALLPVARAFIARPRPRFALMTALALGLALLGAAAANRPLGEMDFGGFDRLLPGWVFLTLRTASLALALFLAWDLLTPSGTGRGPLGAFPAWALLPYVGVSSLTRPAQRYLLPCLPLVLFALILGAPASLRRLTRLLGWVTVVCCLPVDVVGTAYLVAEGRAAENMAQWVMRFGDIEATRPGPLVHHAGQHFPVRPPPEPRFEIVTEPTPDSLHREAVRVFGHEVFSYYLRPLPPGDGG